MSLESVEDFIVAGSFDAPDGRPIAGAAVHHIFLGDPPSNCGTSFDLDRARSRTDDAGHFSLTFSKLGEAMTLSGEKPDAWRNGCYLILAARDSRTIGYTIASGNELRSTPVRLVAVPLTDLKGKTVDVSGSGIAGAQVLVTRYRLFVGRGPYPSAPVNFFLSRQVPGAQPSRKCVADLVTLSDDRGEFLIPQVPAMPGSLDVTISHADVADLETQYYAFQPPMQVTLRPAATVRLRLALPDGQAAAGFKLYLSGIPAGAHSSTCKFGMTDDGGFCKFRGMAAGDYTIRFVGGGVGPVAVPAICVARLATGESREIDRQAVDGSVLRGRVLEKASKQPLEHAEVRFQNPEYPHTASTFQAAYTDADGYFEFEYAIAPGVYDVAVSAWREGEHIGEWHSVAIEPQPRTEVTFLLS